MRVGLFTESYDPIINGVSTSVKTLAAELSGAGHTPIIVASGYRGFVDSEDSVVVRLPSWRTPFNPENPFSYPPLGIPPAALRGMVFDVVHTQQPFGIGMHGRLCARNLGVPLVSTNHTLYNEYVHYFPLMPTNTARTIVSAAMRTYYNTCDAVIAPSRAAACVLEELGVTVPLHVVPTGVPQAPAVLPAAVEQTRRSLSLPPDAPILLYVGRLAREKNLDFLVDAFARLCASREQVGAIRPLLLLVGSGPYLEACRQHVRAAGLESSVRFAGFLKRSLLAPIYAVATLFVFPSATETQGVVLSEAQSHGLPCVVVGAGGAPEFVRDGVDAVVVPNEIDAFAAAIDGLLNDEARRKAMAADALVSPLRPTPADMARQMVGVYESAHDSCKARTARQRV